MSTLTEDDIVNLANQYGVPPELALATWDQESKSGRDVRTSKKGATGDFQVTPIAATAVGMHGADLSDPLTNATVGVKYLAKGYNKYQSPEAAAAFYHAGPDFAAKLAANPDLNDGGIKTIDYVKSVSSKFRQLKGDSDQPSLTPAVYHPDEPVNMGTINVSAPKDEETGEVGDSPAEEATEAPQPSGAPDDYSYLIDNSNPMPMGTINVEANRPPDQGALEDSISGLLKQSSGIADSIITDSATLRDKLKGNLKAMSDSFGREGELQATVGLEKFRQEQQATGERAAVLSKFGVNSGDADNEMSRLAMEMLDDAEQARQMREGIAAKQSSRFIDNPVQAIMDSLTVNDDIRAHNQVVARLAAAKDTLKELNDTAHEINVSNSTKFASTTLKGAEAAADVQREVANQKKLEVDDKLSRVDLDTQIHTMSAINSKIASLNTLDSAITARGAREDTVAARQRKQDMADALDQQAQVAGRVLGLNIQGTEDLKRQRPEIRSAVERIIANGGAEEGKISGSPLEAEQILATGNLNKMPPATQQVAHMLTAAKQEAIKQLNSPQVQASIGKSKDDQRNYVDAKMREILNEHIQYPNESMHYDGLGVTSNPFKLPTLDTMLSDPNAKDLKITQLLKNVKDLAGSSVPLTDGMVFQLALKNVGKGYSDITEAAKDVSDYYKAGVARNNLTYHLDSFGVPIQTNYYGDSTTDMANYKSVLAAMLKVTRANSMSGAVEESAGPLAPAVKLGEKIPGAVSDFLSSFGKP